MATLSLSMAHFCLKQHMTSDLKTSLRVIHDMMLTLILGFLDFFTLKLGTDMGRMDRQGVIHNLTT